MNLSHDPGETTPPLSVFETMDIGLKTLLSEWKWIIVSRLRKIEIDQMRKRLDQEYRILGTLCLEDSGAAQRIELSRKQILFLQQEIAHLELELDKTRQDFIAKRIQRWNLS
jgi:hypothetical protein